MKTENLERLQVQAQSNTVLNSVVSCLRYKARGSGPGALDEEDLLVQAILALAGANDELTKLCYRLKCAEAPQMAFHVDGPPRSP